MNATAAKIAIDCAKPLALGRAELGSAEPAPIASAVDDTAAAGIGFLPDLLGLLQVLGTGFCGCFFPPQKVWPSPAPAPAGISRPAKSYTDTAALGQH